MDKKEANFMDAFVQGAGWALGAAPVLIILYFLHVQHEYYQGEQMMRAVDAAATEMQNSFRSAVPKVPKTVTKNMPGKSTQECLKVTGGIANEEYKKCRDGYQVKIQE